MEVRNQRTNKPNIMMLMMINKTFIGPKNKLRKLKFQKKKQLKKMTIEEMSMFN